MKSLQFELWRECNNLCKMCFLGLENRTTPKHTKIESLNEAIKMTVDFTGEVIAIIGGEFFQGQLNDPEVHDLFYNFLNIVIEKLNNEEIKSSWVTATLTDKTPKDLLEFLNLSFLRLYYTDIWQIPVFLSIIQTVPDHKFVRDHKSGIIYIHIHDSPVRLVEESTQLYGGRSSLL